jgi:hypothetical protein
VAAPLDLSRPQRWGKIERLDMRLFGDILHQRMIGRLRQGLSKSDDGSVAADARWALSAL